ncbi:MAG: excinuclease ABC subunit B [Bacteroidetes bacterium CG02_land_8_20_14_3_00_31_25]|nr:excinuclease ABC subunit UvrB [Bacteroidota bacterium]PIV62118.1 MAG: excinuclease ABC subunit B [Bacteroidetes bacterium CG02_land_8_20_14_3_00_31_25]PIX32335.1 MAG: excinuclease ABC subunit B [Bacteroidetes bacterium CG_4_8_14_3_um_filter_31_14]
MDFKLISPFSPTGDQPDAIKQLVDGVNIGLKYQTLLGVTGSGKTFTIANLLEQIKKPALVLSHNKTLAAQLYSEFKQFFPENRVEYFVSYYDYYQPEAYMPSSDTYIEKDLSINDEIEKLRLSATSALLSGRRDVIVVSSVSCIYGIGNPEDFHNSVIEIAVGQQISRDVLLRNFVDSLYSRTENEFTRGTFRVRGNTVDIFIAYDDFASRIIFYGDEIEEILTIDPVSCVTIEKHQTQRIFPANIFVTSKKRVNQAIKEIQDDLFLQIEAFKAKEQIIEAKRIEERVTFDLEMIKELGYCSGIENYSRYFDGRKPGTRPFCLLDYFPDDFITIIDESHVTVPQIKGMHGGDTARKKNLIEYGFRLPAAADNRPLQLDEFIRIINQVIFVSATPADFELQLSEGIVAEQVIRPTGILDPIIEVRPSLNQVDNLMDEIEQRVKLTEKVLVTTLTKRMAEELTKYLTKFNIKCRYIHSDVETLERVEIMEGLHNGVFDVLIGVNLLREGLDLPEVSLVAILDADKEGFLRSARALTQTAGRAARHLKGKVIMYADKITDSMQKTIDETERRREKQIKYNTENNISPQQIVRTAKSALSELKHGSKGKAYIENDNVDFAADPVLKYMNRNQIIKAIDSARKKMEKEAKTLNFIEAAMYRDEMIRLEEILKFKK